MLLFFFFKEEISIAERVTTLTVDAVAQDNGKYMFPIINAITRRGGTFSRSCSMYLLFCNPMKSKQPDAISQNLEGIRKYAAGWFIGYK